eukprot:1138365-Pelagomonas_calceolata.AAC.2
MSPLPPCSQELRWKPAGGQCSPSHYLLHDFAYQCMDMEALPPQDFIQSCAGEGSGHLICLEDIGLSAIN